MKINPLLKQIVNLAKEKKAEDLVALNVSKITSLSDYFVICSANNLIQVKAIADNIKDNNTKMIKKNLNLTFRPYMVLKLNALAAR